MDRNHHNGGGLGPRFDTSSRVQKTESAADRLAALKARVAAITGPKTTGGLSVGLHPALSDIEQWKPPGKTGEPVSIKGGSTRTISDGSKSFFTRTSQDRNPSALDLGRTNPYLESGASHAATGKSRQPRQLNFNPKGKYIHQANAIRRQAALEAMKKRIAEQTRKVGIDEDLDAERGFIVDKPPDVEWWDQGLLANEKTYDGLNIDDAQTMKLSGPGSIVTELVQHPVVIEPPQDLQIGPAKVYLTKQEQKKLRRQRRMADMKEHQAKQRLGLEPAPAPKVKTSNLIRVLGEEAVKDPTAVEARVNREIAARHARHEQANEDRKLTKEERHEKLANNQEKDAAKGIRIMVFKVKSLANGQHRYKIGINAEQHALTGICIVYPKFSLVVVEGGEHSITKFKKLMLNRIDWTQNMAPRSKDGEGASGTKPQWLEAEDEKGNLKDMSANRCDVVFEGEAKSRAFRKWSSRICETDSEAFELLKRAKVENFWSQAKNMP